MTAGAAGPLPVDSVGMWDLTARLPEQVRDAAAAAKQVGGLPAGRTFSDVVVLGMGGSGIAGDVLVAAAADQLSIPAAVSKSCKSCSFCAARLSPPPCRASVRLMARSNSGLSRCGSGRILLPAMISRTRWNSCRLSAISSDWRSRVSTAARFA